MDWAQMAVSDSIELAYTERGAGPPVVLVPGWTMSGEVFEHQLSGLAACFRVVTFDPRSHGRSTITDGGNNYPQQGRDLFALLDALGLDRVHLVGWSYGALACYVAIEQRGHEVLRSLTVLDETPKPLGDAERGDWAEADLNGFLDEYVGPVVADPEAFAAEFAAWLLDREPAPDEGRWLAGIHLTTPRHVAESLLVSAMFSDYRDVARSLDSRLPYANVVRDDWLAEAQPWLSAHLPAAEVWTHIGFWDRPQEFNARLVRFLERA
jgi:non-heme chloroperoxidase